MSNTNTDQIYNGIVLNDADIKKLDDFINTKKSTDGDAFSPKLREMFYFCLDEARKRSNHSYYNIGTEGYRTISIYKNTNGIYVIEHYFESLDSYYLLEN